MLDMRYSIYCAKQPIQAGTKFCRRLRKALDLIHFASQGRQQEKESLLKLISDGERAIELNKEYQRERTKAKPVKPLSKKEKRKQGTRDFEKATARRHPEAIPILSRPRPVVNGKRHVPVFVNARGVPFLRIKKPQPMNLSGMIRSKLDNRWKRIERRDRLEIASSIAEGEDLWDRITLAQEKVSWLNEVQSSLKAVNNKITESDAKNKKLAEDMWQVVLAERKLAAKEAAKENPEKDLKPASTKSKPVKRKS